MIALPLLAVLAMCGGSLLALHGKWLAGTNSPYSHGYLIVAISIWLLWRDRHARAVLETRPRLRAAVLFLAAAAAWLLAVQSGIQTIELALLPMLLWIALLASHGKPVALRCAFPLAFLYFAIPVWGLVNGVFQWSTVYAVRLLLRLVGIPAFFDGNRVHIAAGTFEIAGGCSGLHFVIVGLAIAALLGELRGDSWRGRAKLLALAAVLAILTNWLRVFSIVLAGHATNMEHYLVSQSHYFYGWILFAVAMIVFFLLERRIPVATQRTAAISAAGRRTAAASGGPFVRVGVGIVMVIAAVVAGWHALAQRPASEPMNVLSSPSGWHGPEVAKDEWQPLFVGVDEEQKMLFHRDEGETVDAYIGLYRSQRQDKEFSGYTNDPRGNSGPEWLVSAWYGVGGRTFQQPAIAQLWYGLRSLTLLRSPPSQVLVLRTACRPDCNTAAQWLHDFEE